MATPVLSNYGLFLQSLLEGRVNLQSDELWVMLVTNSYNFNQNNQKFKSAITAEIVGSGYIAGGQKLVFTPPAYQSGDKTCRVVASNSAWPSVSFNNCRGAVVYCKPTGVTNGSQMPLVSYLNFGETISRVNQAFYINWAPTGAIKLGLP